MVKCFLVTFYNDTNILFTIAISIIIKGYQYYQRSVVNRLLLKNATTAQFTTGRGRDRARASKGSRGRARPARAINRRFVLLSPSHVPMSSGPVSALRIHTKTAYRTDLLCRTLMALERPGRARTASAATATTRSRSPVRRSSAGGSCQRQHRLRVNLSRQVSPGSS